MLRQVRLLTFASLVVAAGCQGGARAPYAVTSSASCPAGERCALRIDVEAKGDFHINEEYPHRFEPSDEALAWDDTRAFTSTDERKGALAATFARAKAAERVRGTLHLSVCSDEVCLIEKVPVDVARP